MARKAKRKKGIVGIEFSADLAGKKPLLGRGPKPPDGEITPTTPLRLERAAEIAFGGEVTAGALRKALRKAGIPVERYAGKDFTTLRDIEEMRGKCRSQRAQGSTCNPTSTATGSSTSAPRGSSETERAKSALAALRENAKPQKKNSASTSPANTKPLPGSVIRLKF
jgi:hypothetical protein